LNHLEIPERQIWNSLFRAALVAKLGAKFWVKSADALYFDQYFVHVDSRDERASTITIFALTDKDDTLLPTEHSAMEVFLFDHERSPYIAAAKVVNWTEACRIEATLRATATLEPIRMNATPISTATQTMQPAPQ
jgi:hypothetical protein